MALLLLQGGALVRAAWAVPPTQVLVMAREVKGRRVPVATRHSGRSGLCRRRLAYGQRIALGLGV
eukprot:737439-Alexandrium_andersonii.AAC.1